jgi:hypothetical protein
MGPKTESGMMWASKRANCASCSQKGTAHRLLQIL